MTKYIGILTAGGDSPGLNAAIRGVGKAALNAYGMSTIGFRDGFRGLMENRIVRLDSAALSGILTVGGTILGTSRDKPHKMPIGDKLLDMTDVMVDTYHKHHLDGLVCLGGGGTQKNAFRLMEKGLNIITLPKTIDNDVALTDVTFGFDTALTIATEAIDRLHTTAEAHHRVMVLELMGRDAGFIALHSGVAGGADVILIPEIPFKFESVVAKVRQRAANGTLFSIMAISEGAKPAGGEKVYARGGDEVYVPRLGGISQVVGEYIEEQGFETRVTVLGHLQRGGTPTAFDRWLATRYGAAAVRVAAEGRFDRMVSLDSGKVSDVPLGEAIAVPKRVDIHGDAVLTARNTGISFGDE